MRLSSHEFNGTIYFQCESDSSDLFRWRQMVVETDQMAKSFDEVTGDLHAFIRECRIALHRSQKHTRKRRMLRVGSMKFVGML